MSDADIYAGLGIPLPTIDPRNERTLLQQSQLVVFNRSQGQLNDFSDHNPVSALLGGFAFASAELLYYVNRLPLAAALAFLGAVTGVSRRLGVKAQVELTFTLTAPLSTPFRIPAGFETLTRDGRLSFFTDRDLIIPSGSTSGVVSATAAEEGTTYNLPAYSINQITIPLAFLGGVVNIEASKGGAEEESIQETIDRAVAVLRERNLVSRFDFEGAAQRILGQGSRVKAIGLLGADKLDFQPGAVHLFCLAPDGSPANNAQIGTLYSALGSRIQLGTKLWISPMDIYLASGQVIARLLPGEDPQNVATQLWDAFGQYLNRLQPGESILIKELEYALRLAANVAYLEETRVNNELLNVPLPNQYTIAKPYSLRCQLVTSDGITFELLRGAGEPEDYDPQA